MTKMYRKRYIPNEVVYLEKDELLFSNSDILITKWEHIKPRDDFKYGYSCYFLSEGFKVSKFYTKEKELLYVYCDIVDISYDKNEDTYIFTDLLIDIIVYNNGFVKVVDMKEIAEALDNNLIDENTAKNALKKADNLLTIIYNNKLDILLQALNREIIKNPIG